MANTGQMLLVLGALLLFSLMLPSLNETLLYNDRTLVTSEVEIMAMSLAQMYLAEAGTKAFDEVCLTTSPKLPSQLTPTASLGRESSETYPNFDDMDDYLNLSLTDSVTMPSVKFTIAGAVCYMDPNNPSTTSASPTFIKRVRVTVGGPYLINPASETATQLTIEQLFAYY